MAHKKSILKKDFFFLILIFIVSGGFISTFTLLSDNLIVITTPSMEPALNVGDLVIKTNKDPNNIEAHEKEGDILIIRGPQYFYQNGFDPLFWNNLPNNTIIVHRAIAKKSINNTWYFLTKGDNNLYPDGAYELVNNSEDYKLIQINCSGGIYIPETEVLGIVAFKIPLIGYINIYFKPIMTILLILIAIFILLKVFNFQIKFEKDKIIAQSKFSKISFE